jgi:hypothetical protein
MNKRTTGQPLSEVFGFLTTDQSKEAVRHRAKRLCPFQNKIPNCTKDKANNPLGVCSVYYNLCPVITCPVRFRENWIIADDAADFFFKPSVKWVALPEVRLDDADGKSAGNFDMVLVAHDKGGKIVDFGAVEIQAVYISGNVRDPFTYYMQDPKNHGNMDWTHRPNYPRPDYLSSSRKRLAPQLLFKGGILHSWNKKLAVVLNKSFFDTLPKLARVSKNKADIAWLLYDQVLFKSDGHECWKLKRVDKVYTEFLPSLEAITTSKPGDVGDFIGQLQMKLDKHLRRTHLKNSTKTKSPQPIFEIGSRKHNVSGK